MKLHLHSAVKVLAVTATMAFASIASAQSAGQLTVKGGLNLITPKVESSDMSAPALPFTKADIGSDTQPVLIFAYGLTDNISVEIPLGLAYKHDLFGADAIAGTGKLGSSKVLPITTLIQYRFFAPTAKIRPYVGVGATYAYFSEATGSGQMSALLNTGGAPSTFKMKNKFAATFQAGVSYAINERWFSDLSVTKTFLKTKATFSTGQTQNIKLDPLGVSVAIGYKF
jgi:outer membrane protein